MNKTHFYKEHLNPQLISPTHTIRIIEETEWMDKCKGWEVKQKMERVMSEWLYMDGAMGLVVEDLEGVKVGQIFLNFFSKTNYPKTQYKFYYQWVKTGGFWILPNHRGKGIGTKMIEYIVKILPLYHIKEIHSTPLSTAYPIFKRVGFELGGENRLGKGLSMWDGRKKLK